MGLLAAVRVAFGALLVHKGRSVLTSLGIVIGIGAVIAMVSAGDGVQSKLDERMATIGRNLVLIRAGARTKGIRRMHEELRRRLRVVLLGVAGEGGLIGLAWPLGWLLGQGVEGT